MTDSPANSMVIINLAAVGVVLIASLVSPKPLESLRPKIEPSKVNDNTAGNKIFVSDWEDPLTAIDRSLEFDAKTVSARPKTIGHLSSDPIVRSNVNNQSSQATSTGLSNVNDENNIKSLMDQFVKDTIKLINHETSAEKINQLNKENLPNDDEQFLSLYKTSVKNSDKNNTSEGGTKKSGQDALKGKDNAADGNDPEKQGESDQSGANDKRESSAEDTSNNKANEEKIQTDISGQTEGNNDNNSGKGQGTEAGVNDTARSEKPGSETEEQNGESEKMLDKILKGAVSSEITPPVILEEPAMSLGATKIAISSIKELKELFLAWYLNRANSLQGLSSFQSEIDTRQTSSTEHESVGTTEEEVLQFNYHQRREILVPLIRYFSSREPLRALYLHMFLPRQSLSDPAETGRRSRYAISQALIACGYRHVHSGTLVPLVLPVPLESLQQGSNDTRAGSKFMIEAYVLDQALEYSNAGKVVEKTNDNVKRYNFVFVSWYNADQVDLKAFLLQSNIDNTLNMHNENGTSLPLSTRLDDNHIRFSSAFHAKSLLSFGIIDIEPVHKVIHLGNSDDLAMFMKVQLKDELTIMKLRAYLAYYGTDFYFPRSSVSPTRLSHLVQAKEIANYSLKRQRITDDELIRNILTYLRLRIPGFDPDKDLILVAEGNTGYASGWLADLKSELTASKFYSDDKAGPYILRYLPRVDGKLDVYQPRGSVSPRMNLFVGMTDTKMNGLSRSNPTNMEESQFDYLIRYGDKLANQIGAMKRKPRAVVIVGSDVHDKLLILQALRPLLPQALFFTTDWDHNFLHPMIGDITKNLLVCSAIDTVTADRAEKEHYSAFGALLTTSFRDSYQTLLHDTVVRIVKQESDSLDTSEARIQEVGNNRLHNLRMPGKDATVALSSFSSALHMNFIRLILILCPGAALYLMARKGFRAGMTTAREKLLFIAFLVASIFGALCLLSFTIGLRHEYSARGWLDGVSAWLSLFFVLAGAIVCVYGLRSLHIGLGERRMGLDYRQVLAGPLSSIIADPKIRAQSGSERINTNADSVQKQAQTWLIWNDSIKYIFAKVFSFYWRLLGIPSTSSGTIANVANYFATQKSREDGLNTVHGNRRESLTLISAALSGSIFLVLTSLVVFWIEYPSLLMYTSFSDAFGHLAELFVMILGCVALTWLVFAMVNWYVILWLASRYYLKEIEKVESYDEKSARNFLGEARLHCQRLLHLNELFVALGTRFGFFITALLLLAVSRSALFHSSDWCFSIVIALLVLTTLLLVSGVMAWEKLSSYRKELKWCLGMFVKHLQLNNNDEHDQNNTIHELITISNDLLPREGGAFEPWFRQRLVIGLLSFGLLLFLLYSVEPFVQFLRGF